MLRFSVLLLAAVLAGLAPGGCRGPSASGPDAPGGAVVIRASLDPSTRSYELTLRMAAEFEAQTGVRVELLQAPADSTERLSQYLQYLGARSPDVDIFQIDVIWPAMLASHLIDLGPDSASELPDFFPRLVENNTVQGRLVAIPWFGDAGLLYYRSDLLAKYGYEKPPETWDELGRMAARIQEGERAAGHRDFWGFVFQARAYEGLTCNALEWQASSGGGTVVDREGRVTVRNPRAAAAFERAAGWVGTIAPRGVTTYGEEEARQMFQGGNAAFMRNWPYAWALANGETSPVRGKVGVTRLPTGGTGHAAALGGWQLGVSRYSRHPREAAEFVRFLASSRSQKTRALELTVLPARMGLYDDPELLEANPLLPLMKEVFLGAVPRPSAQTGDDYNEVSTYYFQAVHKILTRRQSADEALGELEEILKEILD